MALRCVFLCIIVQGVYSMGMVIFLFNIYDREVSSVGENIVHLPMLETLLIYTQKANLNTMQSAAPLRIFEQYTSRDFPRCMAVPWCGASLTSNSTLLLYACSTSLLIIL